MLGSAVSGSFCTMFHYVLPRYTKQNHSDHRSMADKIRSKRRFGAYLYSAEMIQPGSLLLTNNEQDFHSSSETNPPTPRRNCIQKISPRSHTSDAVASGLPPRTHAVLFTGHGHCGRTSNGPSCSFRVNKEVADDKRKTRSAPVRLGTYCVTTSSSVDCFSKGVN